ncbi:NADP-dependent 3-hydroxy acid dehydrogenase YdfG [Nannocystis exedens]|uniref:NADP-dependent 3-hydroxy acid dehydrogenase YdfG n=1 Tax=Nannocystis exedens TaxID=54 RepID=A0A1I1UA04_9BACT|nr:SDR family oxidoreductase [Nannocystis exedens]PCC71540.1 short-chain dehydrogenase/reductase [Nannocystis exedens]SFD67599.1 NADP-dependent 3-hydroxy acid dehydrogenase YdfG [Nannocystis exedens]
MNPAIILVTGASSGIGRLSARTLARAGHTVYAGMRDLDGRNAPAVRELYEFAAAHGVDLRPLELDVQSQQSADLAIDTIYAVHGRLDVLVHNAGHLSIGPAEAFAPEEMMRAYDVNVLGAQRVNRAALPHLRAQQFGLLLWIGSTTTRGGRPPFMSPYAAAKAALDSLAVDYAFETARFGLETTIVVPGAFTRGTSHFLNAGKPADAATVAAYDARYQGILDAIGERLSALTPEGADPQAVADEVARVVALPAGQRPFRTIVDFLGDGFAEVSQVAERVRVEFAQRVGIGDLLTPTLTRR